MFLRTTRAARRMRLLRMRQINGRIDKQRGMLAAFRIPPPCASCPFRVHNHEQFHTFARKLCALHKQPEPGFFKCESIRKSVKDDGIRTGRLLCHSTVYDKDMNASTAHARPCAGLRRHLSAQYKQTSTPDTYEH